MTWVGPDELKAEANGLQRQPDDIPVPPTEGFDEVESNLTEDQQAALDATIARVNEIEQIVDTVIRPNQ